MFSEHKNIRNLSLLNLTGDTLMTHRKGFTLIELIIVIVILGILAVVAAPKFVDLSSDAKVATLQGMKGAMESASTLVYAKALITQKTGETDIVTVSGEDIAVRYGYPAANLAGIATAVNLDINFISGLSEVCTDEWCGLGNWSSLPSGVTIPSTARVTKLFLSGYSYTDECGVYYINYRDDDIQPEIGIETDGC